FARRHELHRSPRTVARETYEVCRRPRVRGQLEQQARVVARIPQIGQISIRRVCLEPRLRHVAVPLQSRRKLGEWVQLRFVEVALKRREQVGCEIAWGGHPKWRR